MFQSRLETLLIISHHKHHTSHFEENCFFSFLLMANL